MKGITYFLLALALAAILAVILYKIDSGTIGTSHVEISGAGSEGYSRVWTGESEAPSSGEKVSGR